MKVYRLLLAYDGLDFHGWQVQTQERSVQGELEAALAVIFQREVPVSGAGRTDTGVHALGQCASFLVNEGEHAPDRVLASLRKLLPEDITALELHEAHPQFHARFSATGRHYLYRLSMENCAPFRRNRWETHYTLDLDRVEQALALLPGPHDFRAFCKVISADKGTLCNMRYADLEQVGDEVHLRFGADRFLHNMVRIILGTLVDIGRGHMEVERMAEILESGERSRGGNTAPPHGLYLVRVDYHLDLLKP